MREPQGGPNLLIGQSGGATAVINASLTGVIAAARESGVFREILGMRGGIEGALRSDLIELGNLPDAKLQALRRTPSAALQTGRYKLQDDDLDPLLDRLAERGITAMIFIGGNDSADTTQRLAAHAAERDYPLQVIHIPKTVDNDLVGTDHCPGYGSLARVMANVVRDATFDTLAAPALYPVKFIETMGRDAGWVAAAGTLGFPVAEWDLLPLVYLPERKPRSAEQIIEAVREDVRERGWSVVIVPETLRDASGRHLGGETPDWTDQFGHAYFPSAGDALARLTREKLGLRARYEKIGSWARMSMSLVSGIDLQEAWDLGQAAVEALQRGETAVMMALRRHPSGPYGCEIVSVGVETMANRVRSLPGSFISSDGKGVSASFTSYAYPLLGPEAVPRYARL
jgi:ATP-dependent phosphofructokinase / diphosphate-dependent phosphofructokinase